MIVSPPSDLPQPAYNATNLQLLRMLTLAAVAGVLGAFAVLGFRWLLMFVENGLYGSKQGLVADAAGLSSLLRAVLPAAGGLLAGLILEYFAGDGKGRRGPDYMEAIVAGRDLMPGDSLLKSAASAASVVSGGSIGREGSMVQLAALTGSLLSNRLRSTPNERHFLIACGAAAGVAGAYNTPIAGSLFVAEIVFGGITIGRLGPLLLASAVSDLVVRHVTHVGPIYSTDPGRLSTVPELFFAVLLGAGAGALGALFIYIMDKTHAMFSSMTVSLWIKMATAGLAVGVLSVIRPEVWGNGYSVINSLLHRPQALHIVLIILLLKTAATILTTSSGAVGGVFTPTLFVGAALGSLGGGIVHIILPNAPTNAYALVGMGAFLAAVTHAPLTAVVMVSEMTFGFTLVPALTLGCLISYYISAILHPASVYGHSKPPTHPTEHLDTG